MKADQRPMNLNLTTIHFPVMAIISVLHRISGILLFLLVPFALYLLHCSLISSASFAAVQVLLNDFLVRFFCWVMLSAAVFHLLAGIRHLLMDCGFFESLRSARIMAIFMIALSGAVIVLMGIWLW